MSDLETRKVAAMESIAADVHAIAIALHNISIAPTPGGGLQIGPAEQPLKVQIVSEVRTRGA